MIIYIFFAVILLFGAVLLRGAPYVPTRREQSETALDLLKLKQGQTLYELGCGDGRVLKLAASKGLIVVGYELNPLLVLTAKLVTYKYRKNTKIIWGDFWKADISNADGIFVFLIDKYMIKLDKKINKEKNKPIKLASFAFKIPDKKPVEEKKGIFLYQY